MIVLYLETGNWGKGKGDASMDNGGGIRDPHVCSTHIIGQHSAASDSPAYGV
jgi:hypothetical protein